MRAQGTENAIEKMLRVALGCLLAAMTLLLVCANLFAYTAHMDADIGGEALLARAIAQNGLRTPATWMASTERRVLSAPNLGVLFVRLTGDMNLSMGIACSLFLLALLAMLWRYSRIAGFGRPAAAAALLLVLCASWHIHDYLEMFALYACYYGGHLIVLFWLMGLYEKRLQNKHGKALLAEEALGLPIAYGMGRQGMRILLLAYVPLLLTELLRLALRVVLRGREKKRDEASNEAGAPLARRAEEKTGQTPLSELIPLAWFLAYTGIAYGTAKRDAAFGAALSRNLRGGPAKLGNTVLPQMVRLFTDTPAIAAAALVLTALALAGFVAAARAGCKEKDTAFSPRSVWALPVALLVSLAAGAFTTVESAPRYYLPAGFVLAFGVGLLWEGYHRQAARAKATGRNRRALAAFVVTFGLVTLLRQGAVLFSPPGELSREEEDVVAYLMEHTAAADAKKALRYGYATFDYANVLAARSGGALTVGAVDMATLRGVHWLTDAAWYPPLAEADHPSYIVTTPATKEKAEKTFAAKGLERPSEIQLGRFTVFFFDTNPILWEE